jgi:hypothetical protein
MRFWLNRALTKTFLCTVWVRVSTEATNGYKTSCDIETWEKHLFLDISPTIIDTLVPSLYRCVRNPQHTSLSTVSATSEPPFEPLHQWNVCHSVLNHFTRQTHPTAERNIINILCIETFYPQNTNRTLLFGSTQSPFWLLKPAFEHAHVHLIPILSWSWTLLLPSDTHRKPNTSIAVVLLPFVTYLLTLPRNTRNKAPSRYTERWKQAA